MSLWPLLIIRLKCTTAQPTRSIYDPNPNWTLVHAVRLGTSLSRARSLSLIQQLPQSTSKTSNGQWPSHQFYPMILRFLMTITQMRPSFRRKRKRYTSLQHLRSTAEPRILRTSRAKGLLKGWRRSFTRSRPR